MSGAEDYSRLDRLVHRLAFARPAVQLSAADMEDGMFARDIAGVALDRPIFVTSLPRAGTTVLLTALAVSLVVLPAFISWLSRRFPDI